MTAQLALVELGQGRTSCPVCTLATKGKRCRYCAKGEIPEHGSKPWTRWVRGLGRTIRARLEAIGRGRDDLRVIGALVYGHEPGVPPELAALFADIDAMPVTGAKYRAMIDRLVLQSQIEAHLPRHLSRDEREAEAARGVREITATRALRALATPARIAEPRIRVELPDAGELAEVEAHAAAEPVQRMRLDPG